MYNVCDSMSDTGFGTVIDTGNVCDNGCDTMYDTGFDIMIGTVSDIVWYDM